MLTNSIFWRPGLFRKFSEPGENENTFLDRIQPFVGFRSGLS